MINIVIGTEAEIDQLPVDAVNRADLIISRHPDDADDVGNDDCYWEVTKDRRDLVGKGTFYEYAHTALEIAAARMSVGAVEVG